MYLNLIKRSFNSKNNYIISSEHGPIGGDEININSLNKSEPLNFGWPIASYGDHYTTNINRRYELAPLKKIIVNLVLWNL